jgi:dCTP diphosphatase
MSDRETTVDQLRDAVRTFVAARAWEPFHSPKNLAMSLAIEAAELMEHFQWLDVDASRRLCDEPSRRAQVREELADVLCYALALANVLDLDLSDAVRDKLRRNAEKYPAEKFYGRYERPRDA